MSWGAMLQRSQSKGLISVGYVSKNTGGRSANTLPKSSARFGTTSILVPRHFCKFDTPTKNTPGTGYTLPNIPLDFSNILNHRMFCSFFHLKPQQGSTNNLTPKLKPRQGSTGSGSTSSLAPKPKPKKGSTGSLAPQNEAPTGVDKRLGP